MMAQIWWVGGPAALLEQDLDEATLFSALAQLTFLYFSDERFDCRKRPANGNRLSGRSRMPPGAVENARGFYMQVCSVNEAMLHVFQVDSGALRAQTLCDCAFVGDDGVGRNVIVYPIVSTDF
jgi:hypothetical protein